MIEQLNTEIQTIKERLRILEGDVVNLDEGRSTVALYKQRFIKLKEKFMNLRSRPTPPESPLKKSETA